MADIYEPHIFLNRDSSTPLHAQISEPIERDIFDGKLRPGTIIENEVSLAARLNVSRPTARRAMQTLVEQGLLLRRRGKGTIVAPKPKHRPFRLSSLNEELRHQGKNPTTEILKYNVVTASAQIANKLDCRVGEHVVELERLRYRDGVPVAILYNWIPARIAPSYDSLLNAGLYETMRSSGITIASTTQAVGAQRPRRRHTKLLGITPRQPVLTIDRTAFDEQGKIVEWGMHTYRGDLYRYESTVFAHTERS